MKRFFRYWNPLKRSVDTVGRSASVSEARKVETSPTFGLRWPLTPFSAIRASWRCWDNILTDAELIRYSTYHKTNLSDTELIGELIRYELTIHLTYLILTYYTLNLLVTDWFDTELIRYWTYQILNFSNTELNRHWPCHRYWTYQRYWNYQIPILNLLDTELMRISTKHVVNLLDTKLSRYWT